MNHQVKCIICKKRMKAITNSHLKKHKITPQGYKIKFPKCKITSNKTRKRHSNSMTGRRFPEELKKKAF